MSFVPRAGLLRTNKGLPINRGLLGDWPLGANTIKAGQAFDLSGNNNTGKLVASPPIVPGIFGGGGTALGFNGTSQSVTLQSINYTFLTGFTISCWAMITVLNSAYHGIWRAPGGNQAMYVNPSNEFDLYLGGAAPNSGALVPAVINTPYHVAMTGSPTTYQMFINGQLAATWTTVVVFSPSGVASIGTDGFSQSWPGPIAQFRMHTRTLSAAEIYQLYANPKPSFGLVQPGRLFFTSGSPPPPPVIGPRVLPALGAQDATPSLDLLLAAGTGKLAHMIQSKEKIPRRGMFGMKPRLPG